MLTVWWHKVKNCFAFVSGNNSVVEYNLAKVGVASSNLVSRSKIFRSIMKMIDLFYFLDIFINTSVEFDVILSWTFVLWVSNDTLLTQAFRIGKKLWIILYFIPFIFFFVHFFINHFFQVQTDQIKWTKYTAVLMSMFVLWVNNHFVLFLIMFIKWTK